MRNVLKVSALLAPLAVPAHAEDPPTCGDIVLLATAEEAAATPRERIDVEYLALEVAGGFTADEAVYRRILADTDAARALVPAVAHVTYFDRAQTSDTFSLQLDDPTHAAALAGTLTGWDCLNEFYGIEVDRVSRSISYAVLEAAGAYDLDAMITQYTQVPGIVSGWRSGLAYIGPRRPPTICGLWSPPSTFHYFFDVRDFDQAPSPTSPPRPRAGRGSTAASTGIRPACRPRGGSSSSSARAPPARCRAP